MSIYESLLAKAVNGGGGSGGSGAMIVTSSLVNGVQQMDKTLQEIYDALTSGTPVYYLYQYGTIGTDYVTHAFLAPITYIYTYEYTNNIRVVVNRPTMVGASASGSTGSFLLNPSTVVFQATGLNAYPTYYRTVYATYDVSMSSQSFV